MSRRKYTEIEINLIIERSKEAFSCASRTQLADILGMSLNNFDGYIRRGTIIKPITLKAHERNVDISWILTGEGEPTTAQRTGGEYQYELIPDAIRGILESGNERLIAVLNNYATSLLARLNAVQSEREFLAGIPGAESEGKPQSQAEETRGIDEDLDKAM